MRQLLALAALLLSVSPAGAYSIMWGSMLAGSAAANAFCHSYDYGSGQFWQDSDADSRTYPGSSFPLSATASAWDMHAGWADSQASATTTGLIANGRGNDSDWGSGDGWASASSGRLFRVVGGSGAVDVQIDLALQAVNLGYYSTNAWAEWSAGVAGVSSIGDSYSGMFDVTRSREQGWTDPLFWAGTLEYGRTYTFDMGLYVDGSVGGFASASLGLLDAPVDAQPVPEPATWLLLGFGALLLIPRTSATNRPQA